MKTISGHIVAVQEDRFRMVDETGRGFLFTLSHKSGLEQADLQRFHEASARVSVHFEGQPNLASGAVQKIELL